MTPNDVERLLQTISDHERRIKELEQLPRILVEELINRFAEEETSSASAARSPGATGDTASATGAETPAGGTSSHDGS